MYHVDFFPYFVLRAAATNGRGGCKRIRHREDENPSQFHGGSSMSSFRNAAVALTLGFMST